MPLVVKPRKKVDLLGPFEEKAEALVAATSGRFCDLRRYRYRRKSAFARLAVAASRKQTKILKKEGWKNRMKKRKTWEKRVGKKNHKLVNTWKKKCVETVDLRRPQVANLNIQRPKND